jgi:hypothetical protein
LILILLVAQRAHAETSWNLLEGDKEARIGDDPAMNRWVVKRSFGWLERCRRPWKTCERKLNTSLQFVPLAFLVLQLTGAL